jgi:hypothetical protein
MVPESTTPSRARRIILRTLAEYVAVEARNLAPLPGDVDFTVGASVAMPGLTAWQGLFEHGRLQAGQSVLVHGAAGAVGSMVTQLAREFGGYFITPRGVVLRPPQALGVFECEHEAAMASASQKDGQAVGRDKDLPLRVVDGVDREWRAVFLGPPRSAPRDREDRSCGKAKS